MTPRRVKALLVANLAVLLALVFVYPAQMLSPGPLQPAHAALTSDCFACHTPWRGATGAQCKDCHALNDIGLRTTKGEHIAHGTPFHQALLEDDCLACHQEHLGRLARERVHFTHALLQPATRTRCSGCHTAPKDDLHRQVDAQCSECHNTKAWAPAQFDHTRWFLLEGEHRAPCSTCHVGGNLRTYTCYGCHEHTPANIRAEHLEEGIRNFEDCAECHRSGDEEDVRREDGGGDD